ncbi:MAG: hypothetical protein QOE71_3431, partial [Pseudonocardiales bacterium]|nr:hypothetical protein [Pseudonocardiales bacterium]
MPETRRAVVQMRSDALPHLRIGFVVQVQIHISEDLI